MRVTAWAEVMDTSHREPADFFISYTARDVEWARWVGALLEKTGYKVVLQDWDWAPGSNFVAEMHRALSGDARVLLIASSAYFESRWTEEEWTAAFYQDQSKVIPVCVEPITLPGLLGPLVRIELHGLQEQEAGAELLRGIGGPRPRDLNVPFPDNPAPAFPTSHWTAIRSRNGEFIGREGDLQSIGNEFKRDSVVVLTGAPGIGKTEIALEFFYRHAAEYGFTCFADGSDSALRNIDLAHAAAEYGLPAARRVTPLESVRELISWLSSQSDWLIVLDDVRDTTLCTDLVSLQRGKLLITTMNEGWPLSGRVLPVKPWDRATTIEYLEGKLASNPLLVSLAEVLRDVPLAASQARSYISSTGMSIDEYVRLLQQRVREVMERGETGAHSTTLTAAIDFNIGQLGPAARELVEICSTLGPEAIPIEIFRSAPPWPELFPQGLGEELVLEDAIAELRRHSLIKRDGPFLFMHQLIQRIILESLDEPVKGTAILRAAAILAAATPQWTHRPENWPKCEKLLPHVLAISDCLDDTLPELAAFLLNRLGTYVAETGDGPLAVELLERGLSQAEAAGDDDTIGSILNNLGNAVADLGDLDRGILLLERALKIKRKRKGTTPMLLSRSVGALGALLRRNGDFATALVLHSEALELLERDPEPDTRLIAEECNDVGACAVELGRFDLALGMHRRALGLAFEDEGPDGPTVGSTYRALANFHEAIDEPDIALGYLDEGLRILRQQIGGSHPDVASCLSQKGLLLISAQRHDDARATLEEAVKISESALGTDHPAVGFKLGNLGIALHELGRIDEALAAHERSLAILRSALRGQDRSIAIQLTNLATTHRAKGDLDEARSLLAEALMLVPIPPIDDFLMQTSEMLVAVSQEGHATGDARPALERLTTTFDILEAEARLKSYIWLARLWREVGETRRSEECLQLAISRDGSTIREWLGGLFRR